jgi:hypothetical protein
MTRVCASRKLAFSLLGTPVNRGKRKGRAPKELNPRLTLD